MIQRSIGKLATFFLLLALAALVGIGNYRYFYPDLPVFPTQQGVPDLSRAVFFDKELKQHTLMEYRGTPVILAFWATWCAPCMQEMPQLAALQKAQAGKLKIIALAEEPNDKFYDTMMEKEIPHPDIFWDQGLRNFRALKLRGLPTTFLIDRDGKMVKRYEGETDWADPAVIAPLKLD